MSATLMIQNLLDSKDASSSSFGSSSVMKHFSRKWNLPKDADPNDVVSNLSSGGILMVTAQRKSATAVENKQNVSIHKAIK